MEYPVKVIVTEDKPKWRYILREQLTLHNIEVIAEAEHGQALIELLKDLKPDVILLDLAMPVMDGNQTMQWINENYPSAKVIIMSLFDDYDLMQDYVMRNVKGVFSKSDAAANFEELADAIRKVYKGSTYFHLNSEDRIRKNMEADTRTNTTFSIRQKEIINGIGHGKSHFEIAEELGLTANAVDKQKKKIMGIIGVQTVSELLNFIAERGLKFFRGPKRS